MKTDSGLDGICNRSYPRAAARHLRLWRASLKAGIRMVRNNTSRHLECVWEGNHWGTDGIATRLGELPRETVISELRALRQAAKAGGDPLTFPIRKPAYWKAVGGRLGQMIPPAFIDRSHILKVRLP
jgi:hypothetical protein